MTRTYFDISPQQEPINEERIREMMTWVSRRMKLSVGWKKALHEPPSEGRDWSLVLPFMETLKNTFDSMCHVPSIGIRKSAQNDRCYTYLTQNDRCYTYLKGATERPEILEDVNRWLSIIEEYVAIRDCLAISYAIDYDRFEGNPQNDRTEIGDLKKRAKPYNSEVTQDHHDAADLPALKCIDFLKVMTCYDSFDAIVAMPPSHPDKLFDLPSYISTKISNEVKKEDCTYAVKTIHTREQMKNLSLVDKLRKLEGTIEIQDGIFEGRTILLLDDIYQSGVSMNYVGMLLLNAGANKILGLACEKTCRNDDNVSD